MMFEQPNPMFSHMAPVAYQSGSGVSQPPSVSPQSALQYPSTGQDYLPSANKVQAVKSDLTPEPEYRHPPDIEINGPEGYGFAQEFGMVNMPESHDNSGASDWSTPPASSGPSNFNTPNTHLTDPYTTSPSPRSDISPGVNGHAGASPRAFPCDQCHRVFDQVHKLNHHRRYHERPHLCEYAGCERKFGTKTHLDRHVNDKHDKIKKFYCTQRECPYSRQGGKSFPRKDNWRRHMVNKHQITPDSEPGTDVVDEYMGGA